MNGKTNSCFVAGRVTRPSVRVQSRMSRMRSCRVVDPAHRNIGKCSIASLDVYWWSR